jgi:antirestriction protein ArdC
MSNTPNPTSLSVQFATVGADQLPISTKPTSNSTGNTNPHGDVYDIITKRITGLLEQGTVPWQKPWKVQTGFPRNLVSKKPYRGINIFLLLAISYESPFWLTFNQAHQLGGNIRKGEKACPVVFWKQVEVKSKETGEIEKIPFLRFYHVFNVAQCDNLKNNPPLSEQLGTIVEPMEIVERMPKRPVIKHGMAKAFYSPEEDFVAMPSLKTFNSEEEYFSTIFHELVHSTGHESRLNRPTLTVNAGFGTDPYCKEELIAEMGAAFLCGHAGIAERTVGNSAAYIKSWLGKLKDDKKLIVQAAAQAQTAADFILATKFEETTPEVSSAVLI